MSPLRKAWVCSLEGCDDPHKARGMCQPHYIEQYRRERKLQPGAPQRLTPELLRIPAKAGYQTGVTAEQRLWNGVAKGGDGDCWEWQGAKDGWGYGTIGVRELGPSRAHRVAYVLTHGPIPDGLVIMHSCDNPPCCNPAHLSLGTHQDNMTDRDAKGRRPPPPLGEDNWVATISNKDVLEIRRASASGESYASIARRLGASADYVSRIARGLARTAA